MRAALAVGLSLWVVLSWAAGTRASSVQVFYWVDGRLVAVHREIPGDQPTAQSAVEAMLAAPTREEQLAGLSSLFRPGTRLNRLSVGPDVVVIDLSEEVLAGLDDLGLEGLYQQAAWSLRSQGLGQSLRLTVNDVLLSDYLPPTPDIEPAPSGKEPLQPLPLPAAGSALSGRKISLSPGHGLRWRGSSWGYERPVYCAPLNNEDLHNVELVAYLNTYLTQDGATAKPYRCLDKSYPNYSTGEPFWHMSAAYWVQHLGYPCTVYASRTGDCALGSGTDESSDSLYSRPLASDYDNSDIYISMHTNGYQGDCYGSCPNGTCTYYDTSPEHAAWGAISHDLASDVNTAIVSAIRNHYGDSTWQNRGALDANGAYAETRVPNRAAILIELAFHDSCDRDALYLQDEFFRSLTMWGVYKGVCDYFGVAPTYALYSSEYVSDTIPSEMLPGQSYEVSITFRNRGVLWTEAKQIRLGAVGDSDPFAPTRQLVVGEVGPGQTFTFDFTMTAPAAPGTYTTDWRMLRESVTWFGATHSELVEVGRLFAPGDFDTDGDVDVEDFGHFQGCLSGVNVPYSSGCENASLDHDADVDEYDYLLFEACLSGPGSPADLYCDY